MPLILGKDVALPVEVRSASASMATWLVPAARVTGLIRDSGLVPYGPIPGRALVSVGLITYVDSDLGSYNEFALAAVVKRDGVVATLIHQLPVDQEFTLAAGREIWGFPKFLTTSTIETGPSGTTGTLDTTDGQRILALSLKRGLMPVPSREVELDTYSFMDGVLRRTPFTMRSQDTKARPGGATLTLGHGHLMADELRSLGLDRTRALSVMHVGRMTATFGEATEV